ncbi:acyl carrier protein [Oricola indica]|uniref:acyl carrier protein n=1 Tax=Oricola indica TaxID=2872591 RepID=UPI003CCBE759
MAATVLDTTIRIIAEKTEIDPDKIKPDTELESLEIESLDLADIIFELEDEIDIDIDLNAASAWDKLKTVSDIADSVSALIDKGN